MKKEIKTEKVAENGGRPMDSWATNFESVTTNLGRCRDCAQGVLFPAEIGFELQMVGKDPDFWYCLYCGSNHVDILDAEGSVITSQDDLYFP